MYCVSGVARGDELNLRAYPSPQSRVITQLHRRQCDIAFLPYAAGNWQKIRVDGWQGWVKASSERAVRGRHIAIRCGSTDRLGGPNGRTLMKSTEWGQGAMPPRPRIRRADPEEMSGRKDRYTGRYRDRLRAPPASPGLTGGADPVREPPGAFLRGRAATRQTAYPFVCHTEAETRCRRPAAGPGG